MAKADRRRGATVSQLRNDIDTGRTGDKVANEDPAASPLGTDDEAAGRPVSNEAAAQARAQELARRHDSRRPASARQRIGFLPAAIVAGLLAFALILFFLFGPTA